jgi:hypothetical protein
MATDLKSEVNFGESRHPQTDEDTIKLLTDEIDKMFVKENLEHNSYLIFKMNPNLEVPLAAIYKEKRIVSITGNTSLIREALSKAKNIVYEKDKDYIRAKIDAFRNKIVVHKIHKDDKDYFLKLVSSRPEYANKTNEKYYDNYNSYTLSINNEKDAVSLYEYLLSQPLKKERPEYTLEQENPYLNLLQKAQDAAKSHAHDYNSYQPQNYDQQAYYYQNYYYQQQNPYYMNMMMPQQQQQQQYGGGSGGYRGGMGGSQGSYPQNYYYYNNYYNSMFIRRAQDEESEQQGEGESQPKESPENHSRYTYGSKPFKPRGYNRYNKGEDYHWEPKKQSHPQHHVSKEEREQRTRINSENFPPLAASDADGKSPLQTIEESKSAKLEKNVDIIRYKKEEIISAFHSMKEVKISPSMVKLNDEDVPVLEKKAKPTLEVVTPSPKRLPEQSKPRKQSTLTNP